MNKKKEHQAGLELDFKYEEKHEEANQLWQEYLRNSFVAFNNRLQGVTEERDWLKYLINEQKAVLGAVREFDKWFNKPCPHGGVMLDFLHEPDVESEMLKMWEVVELALVKLEDKESIYHTDKDSKIPPPPNVSLDLSDYPSKKDKSTCELCGNEGIVWKFWGHSGRGWERDQIVTQKMLTNYFGHPRQALNREIGGMAKKWLEDFCPGKSDTTYRVEWEKVLCPDCEG